MASNREERARAAPCICSTLFHTASPTDSINRLTLQYKPAPWLGSGLLESREGVEKHGVSVQHCTLVCGAGAIQR